MLVGKATPKPNPTGMPRDAFHSAGTIVHWKANEHCIMVACLLVNIEKRKEKSGNVGGRHLSASACTKFDTALDGNLEEEEKPTFQTHPFLIQSREWETSARRLAWRSVAISAKNMDHANGIRPKKRCGTSRVHLSFGLRGHRVKRNSSFLGLGLFVCCFPCRVDRSVDDAVKRDS